jgi:hypothetical protein
MGKKLERTDASQWRKKTELVQMPSGNVAELQRLNLVAMIGKHDDVPNFLLMKVHEQLNGKAKLKVLKQDEPVDEALAAKDAINALLWMAKHVFVYPKLVDGDPQNEFEVNIADIALEDLAFVANYAVGDNNLVAAVERFRDAAEVDVELIRAGEGMVVETE